MSRNDRIKKEWSTSIKEAFRMLGYDGNVSIEDDPSDPKRWFIHHSAFGVPFDGYPSTDDTYSICLSDHNFVDRNGFTRAHLEWLVFDTTFQVPLYYVILNQPDYQRVQITTMPDYKRGEILYKNCSKNVSQRIERLDSPYFMSEIIDLGSLIANLKLV